MVKNSSKSMRIADEIETAVNRDGVANLTNVKTRECTSDRFDGVQIDLYGSYVPVRPVIDAVAEIDDAAIETMDMVNEDEQRLCIFVAYIPEQEHPAFV